MTNRPIQHRIASLAVAGVRREWNLQGHAVDEIQEDYGEDLMVQICFEGRLDPARIWVQVKGTEKDCSTGRLPQVNVKAKQVLRWARTADLVVAVLWDTTNDRGWFTLPQDQFDHVELSGRADRSVRLSFSHDFPFDQTAVKRLAWAARIEHANRSVVYARACLEEAVEMELETTKQFHKGVLASLDFDFGVAINAVKPSGGFTEDFPKVVFEHLKNQAPDDLESATKNAMILGVFEMIHNNCAGNGAPLALVKELCYVFYPLLFDSKMMTMLESARTISPKAQEDATGE
ncbi:DUF4365 domain-containing protein [Streptomyces sp. NPDC018964]|uniref:DUF4365 domain-containing protein n=1 Tax=Streptomyces sp. NPDC018964 TaxID=3365058 RepID=UPI00378AC2DA